MNATQPTATETYDPHGRSRHDVNYTSAYLRAHRLTALFLRLTRHHRQSPIAIAVYDRIWDRTAADLEGVERPVRSLAIAP